MHCRYFIIVVLTLSLFIDNTMASTRRTTVRRTVSAKKAASKSSSSGVSKTRRPLTKKAAPRRQPPQPSVTANDAPPGLYGDDDVALKHIAPASCKENVVNNASVGGASAVDSIGTAVASKLTSKKQMEVRTEQ